MERERDLNEEESDIRSKCYLLTKYLGVKARRLYSAGGKKH